MRVNITKTSGFGQTDPFLKLGNVYSGNEGTGTGWERLTGGKWGAALQGLCGEHSEHGVVGLRGPGIWECGAQGHRH